MALTTIPSELSSVSGISDSSSSTAITIDSSQNVTFAGNITTGSNTISGVLSSVTGSIGSAATATTQAASDNSTKLATTAYVTTALANLVDSAPGTLNTLNELAAALGDDENFSTTVTNSIATKLPLAGGTMTGDLILGDNVKLEIGSASGGDLQIFHDGFNSFITDAGTGSLFIRTSIKTQLQNADGTENYAIFNENGAVNLYHDNSVKFETASGGVAIHEDTDKVVRFAGNIGEIGSVTGFQATNTDQSSLVDFGMRATTLRFATGSAERMRIDASGNILLGTDVTTAGNEGVVYFAGNSLRVTRDGNEPLVLDRLTDQGKLIEIRQAGTTRGLIGTVANDLFICSGGNNSGHNGLRFHANGILPTDDSGNIVDADADLGISTHRFKDLHLSGAATIGGNLSAAKLTSADGVLELDDNGTHNGIINAPASMRINFDSDNNSTGESFQVGVNATNISGSNILFQVNEDGSVFSVTPGTSSTRYGYNAGNSITSGGNYNVFMGSDAGTAVTTGDSNVAIGFKALFVEDTSGGSVAIGDSALRAQNSSATSAFNTAVGFSAGTAITTGVQNVYVGALAGDAAQATSDNVGVGYASLSGNIGGQNNVAVGPYALQSFTVSSGNTYNTAIGSQAGSGSSVTGSNNTWIGGYAGQYATTAHTTVFIGYLAGRNASTGVRNVGIGGGAMENGILSGTNNTGIGHNTQNLTTSGSHNVSLGAYTLDANQTGNYNVAVGISALTNSTGNYNTVVGGNAGISLLGGTQNVFLGYQAGYYVNSGTENVIIGSNAVTDNGGNSQAVSASVYIGTEAGGTQAQNNAVVIGYKAGYRNYGGASVFLGAYAGGYANSGSSGNHNNCIGYRAGYSLTSGSDSVYIGTDAGYNQTTGHRNVYIGRDAAQNSVSASNNVCIGEGSSISSSSSNNCIVIGEGVTGGSNTVTFGSSSNKISSTFVTTPNWAHSSDERLKKNIQDVPIGLSFINSIRPVTFNWKGMHELDSSDSELAHLYKETEEENEFNTEITNWGFVAQEIKASLDSAGVTDWDGWEKDEYGVQRLAHTALVEPLVKAVQELSAEVTALKAEVAALKGE